MEVLSWRTACCLSVLCAVLLLLRPAEGIRFVIDREECFLHNVEYEGDTVHVSYVVIKADTPWRYSEEGVDLVIQAWGEDLEFCKEDLRVIEKARICPSAFLLLCKQILKLVIFSLNVIIGHIRPYQTVVLCLRRPAATR